MQSGLLPKVILLSPHGSLIDTYDLTDDSPFIRFAPSTLTLRGNTEGSLFTGTQPWSVLISLSLREAFMYPKVTFRLLGVTVPRMLQGSTGGVNHLRLFPRDDPGHSLK